MLHFGYRRHASGEIESDFELDNAAGLAFAARATSSFPGAFPPARIVEMDEVVAQQGDDWPRPRRIHRQVRSRTICAPGIDPTTASFLDGSVLNNRPFQRRSPRSTAGRPIAQVDRRLVYIDPHPAPPGSPRHQRVPGFFATLRGALSDIPSSQPVIGRARLGDRVQRPGAAAAGDHRQRAPADQPVGGQGRHQQVRWADLDRRPACLARAGELACRARRRFCLPGLCAAQARIRACLRRPADRQAAGRAAAIAAVARGGGDHRRLGRAQGHRLRARRQRGARVRDADRGATSRPGSNICWPSTSNTASAACIS